MGIAQANNGGEMVNIIILTIYVIYGRVGFPLNTLILGALLVREQ
jgi:hypothetical protein